MTPQDYTNKRNEMLLLSEKLNKTEADREQIRSLAADVSLYEANNGLVDENEFQFKKP